MPRQNPEDLEKLIHRTLRSLPDRRAPRSLESRVLAAIAARQELPWWRQSYAHWPQPARAAFLGLTAILAAACMALFIRTGHGVDPAAALSGPMAFFARLQAIGSGIGGFCSLVVRSFPLPWLYGALAFLAAMYAALIGLGAAAYRAFFQPR